ncbi:hypothetical protein EJ02DRAFT_428800 [Clathrospora elynae]|uniref:Uncharacterized protein n=1 Tax=Clathrospora elynae TaxID=706981 RepID=A0A6A5S6M5_9PLEO|nr:hypothetical protein EJ02DRAFT_428800 [Clathrospora elynae]
MASPGASSPGASSPGASSPGEASDSSEDQEAQRRAGNEEARLRGEGLAMLKKQNPLVNPTSLPPPPLRQSQRTRNAAFQARSRELQSMEESLEADDRIDEGIDEKASHTATTGVACKCANTESILVTMLRTTTHGKRLDDRLQVKLIDEWYRASHDSKGTFNDTLICYNHTQFTAGKMGVKTRNANHTFLKEVLLLLYSSRDCWGSIQTDVVMGSLFIAEYRGTHQHSDLKSYRYRLSQVCTVVDWKTVGMKMGWEGMTRLFRDSGSINLDCFGWVLQDPELVTILDELYRMYEYHSRRIDGNSNMGWCRTMYHSPMQQLMRGNPQYWLYYAVLWEDPHLVSYPYYTKYTKAGNPTYFRHIDCNIANAVKTGNGANMIQGSVSWDNEDSGNCTQTLIGFHRIIAEYQKMREASNMKNSTGYIELWDDARDFPQECRDRFPEVQWRNAVCKAGQVRITSPLIPHGSTGPATKERRTMLPWFVKVHDDMSTMEVPKMGSYAKIATAHQQLTAAPTSPSGHPN